MCHRTVYPPNVCLLLSPQVSSLCTAGQSTWGQEVVLCGAASEPQESPSSCRTLQIECGPSHRVRDGDSQVGNPWLSQFTWNPQEPPHSTVHPQGPNKLKLMCHFN